MRRHLAETYHWAVWLLLRCCFITCSREEVRNRAYDARVPFQPLSPDIVSLAEPAVALAKDLYNAEDERIRHLDDKAKSLLNATSILFTLTGGLIALTANREIDVYRGILCVAFLFLLVTLFLLLGVCFGINRFTQPALTELTVIQLEQGQKQGLISDYHESTWMNARVREFLVDGYRAARRTFLCSMLLLSIAGIVVLVTDKGTDAVARRLRSDPDFIRSVQGAKGDPGQQGPVGPMGPKGETGPAGSVTPSAQNTPKP